jgi:hypothetical protein
VVVRRTTDPVVAGRSVTSDSVVENGPPLAERGRERRRAVVLSSADQLMILLGSLLVLDADRANALVARSTTSARCSSPRSRHPANRCDRVERIGARRGGHVALVGWTILLVVIAAVGILRREP